MNNRLVPLLTLAAAVVVACGLDYALGINAETFDPAQHGWWHVLFGQIPEWLGFTRPSCD